MRWDTTPPPVSCGIDLPARALDVCILHQASETLLHRNLQATPAALLQVLAPYRPDRVVAVACRCTWYWLANRGAAAGRPCVLGPARAMQALQGGKAKHDPLDAHQRAVLLRGGLRPPASVSPAARRATRALRRRRPLAHHRGARLAQGPNPHRPSKLPALGQHLADPAHRDGVAPRLAAPAVPKSREVARALVSAEAPLLRAVARPMGQTAQQPDAHPLSRRHPRPGRGTMLRLVRRAALQPLERCPRGPAFASACRLSTGAKASNGPRSGPSGRNMGQAPLQWAFADAAVLFLRETPEGQHLLRRWENHPDTGTAWTLVAPQ
jgi:hypothetical protein